LNRSRIFLAAGVALALVAFVAVLAFGTSAANNQPAAPTTVKVMVAAQDIMLGTRVDATMVAAADRPASEGIDAFAAPDQLVGAIARRAITRGDVVHSRDFQTASNPGTANIAGAVRPGLRAIAVPLDKVTAVAYLIQPGDYVDVLLALDDADKLNPIVAPNPRANAPITGPDGTSYDTTPFISLDDWLNNTTVKVLVQNVQVLAAEEAAPAPQSNVVVVQNNAPAFVVVLAVTPQQAEMIRFAQLDGNVSLVLRSPDDQAAGEVPTSGITLAELVEMWGVLPPKPVLP
jgi:Flp pilus assembly protein CpaB